MGLSIAGGYPWFINGSSSTLVFIKNTTSEDQQFHLDIVYLLGGRWRSNLKTLAPGQTFELDVRKVRDSQMVKWKTLKETLSHWRPLLGAFGC